MQNAEFRMKKQEGLSQFFILHSAFCIGREESVHYDRTQTLSSPWPDPSSSSPTKSTKHFVDDTKNFVYIAP
jgi:hypothetical protein